MPSVRWTKEQAAEQAAKGREVIRQQVAERARLKALNPAQKLSRDELFKRENLNSIRRGIRKVHRAIAASIEKGEPPTKFIANLCALTKMERNLVNGALPRGKASAGPAPKTFSPPVELAQVSVSDVVKSHNTSLSQSTEAN